MADLPNILQGTRWWETSARQWQNLVRVVERFDNLTTGPGLLLERKGRHSVIRLRGDGQLPKPSLRRVAILGVDESAGSIEAREVRYDDKPPQKGRFAFAGGEFTAYPMPGIDIEQFSDAVLEGGVLTAEVTLFDARRIEDEWFVQTTGGGGGGVFPVELDLDYTPPDGPGGPGSASTSASWLYVMKRPITGEVLLRGVSLDATQHVSARIIGRMNYATFGLAAYIPPYTTPSLIWCNETISTGVCSG